MRLRKWLLGTRKSQTKDPVVDSAETKELVIDLRALIYGHTKLGSTPDPRDFFTPHLKESEAYTSAGGGLEIGTKQGALDYVFVTIGAYQGSFTRNGVKIPINPTTAPERIPADFGEPYWVDSKDEELILFYELEAGRVELQFEFPDRKNLGYITFMRDGILSRAEQRRLYGVTKEWPPVKG